MFFLHQFSTPKLRFTWTSATRILQRIKKPRAVPGHLFVKFCAVAVVVCFAPAIAGADAFDFYSKTTVTPTHSYFNIGPSSTNYGGMQYVSHGRGVDSAGLIKSITLFYVTNAVGVVNANISFYDGRVPTGFNGFNSTPSLLPATFNVVLPGTSDGVLTAFSHTISSPATYFYTFQDFEWGIKHLSGGTIFGPQVNPGTSTGMYNFPDAHLGGVGQAWNVFEIWNPLQKNDFSGTQVFQGWYGATSPWASAALRLSTAAVPEPSSGILILAMSIGGGLARTRRGNLSVKL